MTPPAGPPKSSVREVAKKRPKRAPKVVKPATGDLPAAGRVAMQALRTAMKAWGSPSSSGPEQGGETRFAIWHALRALNGLATSWNTEDGKKIRDAAMYLGRVQERIVHDIHEPDVRHEPRSRAQLELEGTLVHRDLAEMVRLSADKWSEHHAEEGWTLGKDGERVYADPGKSRDAYARASIARLLWVARVILKRWNRPEGIRAARAAIELSNLTEEIVRQSKLAALPEARPVALRDRDERREGQHAELMELCTLVKRSRGQVREMTLAELLLSGLTHSDGDDPLMLILDGLRKMADHWGDVIDEISEMGTHGRRHPPRTERGRRPRAEASRRARATGARA